MHRELQIYHKQQHCICTFIIGAYSVSQKSSPLKLFAIFSLRLSSIFTWNFANLLPVYLHMLTNFGRFIFMWQNGVNFSKSTYRFHGFKFRVSTSQIAFTSSLMMSGHNSPNLNPLNYRVWSNAGVLAKAATEANTSSRVLKCTLVILVCVTGCPWQRYERRQTTAGMCVSQGWTFWTFNVVIHLTDTNCYI